MRLALRADYFSISHVHFQYLIYDGMVQLEANCGDRTFYRVAMECYHNFNGTYFLYIMSLAYGKTQLEPKFLEATLLIEINFNHKQNY